MMGLFHSWRNSLLLLAPHNLKLFVLTTLKSTLETYKVLARNILFWALAPVLLLINETTFRSTDLATRFMEKLSVPMYLIMGQIFLGAATWITVTYCLASRSSMGQKNMGYFEKHRRFVLALVLVVILLWQLNFWLNWFFASYYYELTRALALSQALAVFVGADFVPLCIFFLLFFLDSGGSLKQLWYAAIRAVKMTVYNLPLLVILIVAMLLPIFILIRYGTSHQLGNIWYIGALLIYIFLLKPLLINIWTNIYVKKLHETPKLYE